MRRLRARHGAFLLRDTVPRDSSRREFACRDDRASIFLNRKLHKSRESPSESASERALANRFVTRARFAVHSQVPLLQTAPAFDAARSNLTPSISLLQASETPQKDERTRSERLCALVRLGRVD